MIKIQQYKSAYVVLITTVLIISGFVNTIIADFIGNPDEIDEQQIDHSEELTVNFFRPYVAQSFIPDTDVLTKIEIYGSWPQFGFYYVGISSIKSGQYESDWLSYILVPTLNEWTMADIPDIAVTPGDTYYLMFRIKSNTDFVDIHYSDDNPYSRGILSYYDNTEEVWINEPSCDLAFKIWGFYDNQPPYQPSTPDPYNGEDNVNINHDISWSGGDPDGDTVYYKIWFGTDSTPDSGEIVKDFNDHYTSTSYDPGTLSYSTTYYWKIQGQDIHGATGSESNVWHFTTEDSPNDPPNRPDAPTGPTTGWHNTQYTYCAQTTDPNQDDIYYKFDWGDGTNSGWLGPYDSGEQCCTHHTWEEPNTYYVKVRAKDIHEEPSEWSPALQVYMGNRAPNTPEPPSGPITGWHCTEYQYSAYTTDPDDDDLYYKYDWGDGTYSDWLGPYDSGTACYETHTWTWPDTFHVRSKAKDIYNDESSWSQPLIIDMGNRAPEQPSNPDPEHYATWIDINTDLNWTCSDPDGDCDDLHYDIYLGLIDPPPLEKENHQTTTYNPGQLQPGETYYWQIIAYDPFDGEREGPVWQFTTRVYHPPVLSNYDGWPEGVDREWGKCSDPFTFKVNYYDSDEDPPAIKDLYVKHSDNQWYNYSMEKMGGDPSWDADYTITLNGSVFGGGEHYYYFLYKDGTISPDARLPEDGYWNFTVNYPPEKPDISGPNQLKKNVEYSFDTRTTDENGDDVQYWFDWGDDTNTNWVPDYFVPSGTNIQQNHTWTKTGNYEIKVKARDIHGDESPWGILEVNVPLNSLTSNNLLLKYLNQFEREISQGGLK